MRRGPRVNLRLPPLPSEAEILCALIAAPDRDPRARRHGVSANILADHLGLDGARRLGRGAVKGSWSGTMSPSLRLAPRLAAMEKRGLLERWRHDYRWYYEATDKGRAAAEEE